MAVRAQDPQHPFDDHPTSLTVHPAQLTAEAFDAIFRAQYRLLVRQAERRLGSREEAEDAVQEALERALRAYSRFGANGDLRVGAWLSRIVSNVCHSRNSRKKAESAIVDRVGRGNASLHVLDVADEGSDPVLRAEIYRALEELPAAQRQAFVLRVLGGMGYAELAERTGVSEDNARARVHRARRSLARKVQPISASLGAVVFPVVVVGPVAGRRRLTQVLGWHRAPAAPRTGMLASVWTQVTSNPVVQSAAASPGVRSAWIVGLVATVSTGTLATVAVTSTAPSGRNVVAATVATVAPGPSMPSSSLANVRASGPQAAPRAVAIAPTPPTTTTTVPPPSAPTPSTTEPPSSAQAAPGAMPPTPSVTDALPVVTTPTTVLPSWESVAVAAGTAPATPTTACPVAGGVATGAVPDPFTLASAMSNPIDLPTVGSYMAFTDPLGSYTLPGAPAITSTVLQVAACIAPLRPELSFTFTVPGYEPVTGSGSLVNTLGAPGDLGYLYRGSVQLPAVGTDSPAGLTADFVAQIEVREPANTAVFSVDFVQSGPSNPPPSAPAAASTVPEPAAAEPVAAGS